MDEHTRDIRCKFDVHFESTSISNKPEMDTEKTFL